MAELTRNRMLARFIALNGVRNVPFFEELHSGIFPSSIKGDFSDVKVTSPLGQIAWKELSRFSDLEMRKLMLQIEEYIFRSLEVIPKLEKDFKSPAEFEAALKDLLWDKNAATWDISDQEWNRRMEFAQKLKDDKESEEK